MSPDVVDVGDDYYSWREGTYRDMAQRLKPWLHPVLGKWAWELVEGLDELVNGNMKIGIRTKCSTEQFEELFSSSSSSSPGKGYADGGEEGFLTRPLTKVVEIYCPAGAVWDEGYANVLHRDGWKSWQQRCVRVERERGVRMGDVLDGLRGVLKIGNSRERLVSREEEGEEGEVLLEWRFGCAAMQIPVSPILDGSG
jgi:hypothetical protein